MLFGAPAAGGFGVGTLLAVLGAGSIASVLGGALAIPVALFIANDRLSNRGKKQLLAARHAYALDTARGLAALETVAQSGALPEVRLEAAALVAEHHLELGDVRGAIDALSIHEQDAEKLRRRRNWETGLRAEVLRSILAWLSPGSFTASGVAPSEAFDEQGIHDEGRALIAVLRVLERASDPDDGALASAWRDARGTGVSRMYPTLSTIALAVVAERVHHLLDPLHERLEGPRGEHERGVLRQLFPRMQLLDAGGYRQASAEEPLSVQGAIAVAAPRALVKLAQSSDLPVPRSEAPLTFVATFGALVLTSIVAGLAGGSVLIGGLIGFALSIYFGTPFAAIWGSRRTQAKRRAHRIASLAALEPAPPEPWLVECASGPPGPVTRSSGYRYLLEIPEGTMVLYVAVAGGEDALRRLELEEAWSQVRWWFEGFSGKLQHADPMYGAGASLVRIAALTGHVAEARRLLTALPERGNEWDGPQNRTAWGNAPRAVRLADALVLGLEGAWELAASRLDWARAGQPIHLGEHDRALYEELTARSGSAGVPASWTHPCSEPSVRAWAGELWTAASRPRE